MRSNYRYYVLLALGPRAHWPYYPLWAGVSPGAAQAIVAQLVLNERLALA